MFKDKIRWIDIKAIFLIGVCYIPAFIYRLFNREIWLVSERKYEARDNGYWMYKYIKENHLNQKCYYVISKNAVDRKKIEKYGGLVNHGSLRHFFMFIATRIRISAHVDADTPNSRVTNFMDRHHLLINKRVFLQHGITKDKISFGYYEVSKADVFTCAGIKEYEFCKKEFGYPEGNVVLTGFARYDGLVNNLGKKIIAVIPTWRSWLCSVDEDAFIKSEYYLAYCSFLNNEKLLRLLNDKSYKLVFYLHSEMQKFNYLFKSNDNIVIANQNEYDLQDLLCESKMLITDYSSVAFDFGYLKKPVIYYHFDYREYRKNQHPEGYFDYGRDGFGPIFKHEEKIVEYISSLLDNKCKIENAYLERIESFFRFFDNNNCLRVYDEIRRL